MFAGWGLAMAMDIGLLTLLTVFFAGMASFLSPCVLPIVPGYISYFSGQSGGAEPKRGRM
ncbi:hypothetical protein JVW21_21360, partial [Vibrio cholerae O1]|nr:hypothetical protein [Vibrio cholerae O1]